MENFLFLLFMLVILTTVFTPHQKSSRSSLKDLELQREADIGGEPKDDDHPNIKEIRRRLVAMIEEAAECNFI